MLVLEVALLYSSDLFVDRPMMQDVAQLLDASGHEIEEDKI